MLYAPFVKAADKVKKDVADLSLSDFHPKRFALNYDPPMISKSFLPSYHLKFSAFCFACTFSYLQFIVCFSLVLEYLVPTTGKLYHHKMKLRRLTGSSTVKEAMSYL